MLVLSPTLSFQLAGTNSFRITMEHGQWKLLSLVTANFSWALTMCQISLHCLLLMRVDVFLSWIRVLLTPYNMVMEMQMAESVFRFLWSYSFKDTCIAWMSWWLGKSFIMFCWMVPKNNQILWETDGFRILRSVMGWCPIQKGKQKGQRLWWVKNRKIQFSDLYLGYMSQVRTSFM